MTKMEYPEEVIEEICARLRLIVVNMDKALYDSDSLEEITTRLKNTEENTNKILEVIKEHEDILAVPATQAEIKPKILKATKNLEAVPPILEEILKCSNHRTFHEFPDFFAHKLQPIEDVGKMLADLEERVQKSAGKER